MGQVPWWMGTSITAIIYIGVHFGQSSFTVMGSMKNFKLDETKSGTWRGGVNSSECLLPPIIRKCDPQFSLPTCPNSIYGCVLTRNSLIEIWNMAPIHTCWGKETVNTRGRRQLWKHRGMGLVEPENIWTGQSVLNYRTHIGHQTLQIDHLYINPIDCLNPLYST